MNEENEKRFQELIKQDRERRAKTGIGHILGYDSGINEEVDMTNNTKLFLKRLKALLEIHNMQIQVGISHELKYDPAKGEQGDLKAYTEVKGSETAYLTLYENGSDFSYSFNANTKRKPMQFTPSILKEYIKWGC